MLRILASLVVALTMFPAAIAAQDWSQPWADAEDRPPRVDFSVSTGFLVPTRWSNPVLLGSISPAFGVLEQVFTRDLRVEPDVAFTAATTYWQGRYGFRTQAGFSRSSLTVGSPLASTNQLSPGDITSVGIDTWLYDVRGAIGFREYHPSRRAWPYGFLGIGGITYHLKSAITPPLTFIEQPPPRSDGRGNTVIVANDGRQLLIAVDALSTETVFAVNLGIGTDFRIPLGPGGVGLRVEVADHLAPSPVGVRIRELSSAGALVSESGLRSGLVQHLSVTAGLVVQIGR